ncbi:multi antimicrobial extrusion protein (Na(+)/drug antiporter), MATE family of MDR efflux pumps [Lachnospiraceae bacterium KM106-2]|nr:multi antimicrobial extrusion protein (Na(+)/drug antiporter), MATE family of MDR efflux pumps [Lachnospiraceae bacterium KM106-2]
MEKHKVEFSKQKLKGLIIPLIIEQFLAITVGLADSIMVASVGEAAVSAVSLVDNINVLLVNAFTALGTGGAIVAGQYIGKRNYKKANGAADQLVVFIFVISLVITSLLYVSKYMILHGLFGHISADVMNYANTYFMIVEASIPFLALYSAVAALFRVMGNSSISMKISLIMNGINLVGNAILIFGLHCGVEGVAIPTLVSRISGAFIGIFLIRNQSLTVHISRPFRYHYDGNTIHNILRLGVPSGIDNSLFQLGKILLLSVASAFGTASIAANAIANTIAGFQILVPSAIGVGMITIVSQCAGAGEFDQARYYTRRLMKIAYISMFASNVIIFALLPGIIHIYGVSKEAGSLAMKILFMHGGIGIFIWPIAFTLPQPLKAAGDTTFVMVASIITMWTFRIMFGVWFAKYLELGVLGIWMAMFIDWFVRALLFLIRYRGHKWETKMIKN